MPQAIVTEGHTERMGGYPGPPFEGGGGCDSCQAPTPKPTYSGPAKGPLPSGVRGTRGYG